MSAFLVACLLLIPGNLSRIKTPLRKNGPRTQHLLCKWQQIPRAPAAGLTVLLGHPPPPASSILTAKRDPQSSETPPELGDTPKVQAQFCPQIMELKSCRLSLLLLSRI